METQNVAMTADMQAELASELHAEAVANGCDEPSKHSGGFESGYENSAACKLVASHCCVCGRPLVDALSVTSGIGPVCAEKYGAQKPQAEANYAAAMVEAANVADAPKSLAKALDTFDAQSACNVATHYIAAKREGREVACLIALIYALGYHTLAQTLVENLKLPTIKMEVLATEKKIAVSKTPFMSKNAFQGYLDAIKAVPGRKWNAAAKRNEFPFASATALRATLRKLFAPGTVVVGTRITAL